MSTRRSTVHARQAIVLAALLAGVAEAQNKANTWSITGNSGVSCQVGSDGDGHAVWWADTVYLLATVPWTGWKGV